ncbi:hypothetical protein N0V88_007856 [Collariella sp. IMI 366227]|nr:hypothetical protein N0V88_007856 [Collariella sp. IMI 366227]
MARPYSDSKEDEIVQLLLELIKLRPRQALYNAELSEELDIDTYNLDDPDDAQDFENDIARWVDTFAVRARCTAAGLDEESKSCFTVAGDITAKGLDPGYPRGLKTNLDCHVMASAQYIFFAGGVIHDIVEALGQAFQEIVDVLQGQGGGLGFKLFEKNREAFKNMVIKAWDKMVTLQPDLLSEAEPGSSFDTSAGPRAET